MCIICHMYASILQFVYIVEKGRMLFYIAQLRLGPYFVRFELQIGLKMSKMKGSIYKCTYYIEIEPYYSYGCIEDINNFNFHAVMPIKNARTRL